MNVVYEKLMQCYQSIKQKISFQPKLALVLGSGLGDYANDIQIESTLSYHEIDGFPVSTVEGHKGQFVFGYVEEIPVVIMQGRVHYYEGYSMDDVVLPTRLMGLMGAKVLFLTNASGSVNIEFKAGDFMLLKDQISSFVPSPLIGPDIAELGCRFPDMSEIYDKELCDRIRKAAGRSGILLREGTYIQLSGPQFESPAEVKMCHCIGADAVGMSTACEAVAAKHMGIKVCGISLISNLGAGISECPLTDKEVYDISREKAPVFQQLITEVIMEIGSSL